MASTVADTANRKLYGLVYSRKTTGKFKAYEVAKDDDLIIRSLPKDMMRKALSRRSNSVRYRGADRLSEHYNGEGKESTEMVTMKEKSKAECSKLESPISEGVSIGNGRKEENKNLNAPMKRKRGADGEIVCAFLSSPQKSLSRLRPRKVVPAFRLVYLEEKDDELVIGKRIKVYWPDSRRWFTGRIVDFDNKNKLHSVLYEDGDKEVLDLRKEQFQLEVMPTDLFNLQSENSEGKRSSLKAKRKGTQVIMDDSVSNVDVIPKKAGEFASNTVGDIDEPGEPSSQEDETNIFLRATQVIEAEAATEKSHSEPDKESKEGVDFISEKSAIYGSKEYQNNGAAR